MIKCNRCAAITKTTKTQCKNAKRKNSIYCWIHSKKYKKFCGHVKNPNKLNNFGFDQYKQYKNICKKITYKKNICKDIKDNDKLHYYSHLYHSCGRKRREFTSKCLLKTDVRHEKAIKKMLIYSDECYDLSKL